MKASYLAALALAGCTAPTAAAEQAPAGSPVACHGALAVDDGRIVGAHGEPVTLRGMSLFWSQWGPQYYTSETVDWLAKDWKVDVVRAAIAAEGNDGARQHFAREFAKASTVIDAAVANGIYVVVDWHAHRAYPEDAQRFLTAIARKYGHLPNLIYEDWNEPLRDGVDWSRDVKPYHLAVIGAIRAVDPDNLVIAGSPSWSQDVDVAAADPLPFENLAYTLHYYAATHREALREKGDAALAQGPAGHRVRHRGGDRQRADRLRRKPALVGLGGSARNRLDGMVDRRPRRDQRGAEARNTAGRVERGRPHRVRQAAARKAPRRGRPESRLPAAAAQHKLALTFRVNPRHSG